MASPSRSPSPYAVGADDTLYVPLIQRSGERGEEYHTSTQRKVNEVMTGQYQQRNPHPIPQSSNKTLVGSGIWLSSPSPSRGHDAYLRSSEFKSQQDELSRVEAEAMKELQHAEAHHQPQQERSVNYDTSQQQQPSATSHTISENAPFLGRSGEYGVDQQYNALNGSSKLPPATEPPKTPTSPPQRIQPVVIQERKVVTCDEMLPSTNEKIEGQRALHNVHASRGLALVECIQIFSAATTMMVISTTMRTEIDASTRDTIGEANVDILTNAVAFGTLPFFWLIILRINNYFSERMYYKYLQRGMILDFPLADYTTFAKKPETIAFLVYLTIYTILAVVVLILVKVRTGNFIIFLSNLGTGVALSWYNNQTIEVNSISLVKFIESFKDGSGEYDNIDATSLNEAALRMTEMTLVEAGTSSYTGTIRNLFYDEKQSIGAKGTDFKYWKQVVNISMYATVIGICVLGVVYMLLQGDMRTDEVWNDVLNPCISACVAQTPGIPNAPVAPFMDASRCAACVCQCTQYMKFELRLGECPNHLNVVNPTTQQPDICLASMCPAACSA